MQWLQHPGELHWLSNIFLRPLGVQETDYWQPMLAFRLIISYFYDLRIKCVNSLSSLSSSAPCVMFNLLKTVYVTNVSSVIHSYLTVWPLVLNWFVSPLQELNEPLLAKGWTNNLCVGAEVDKKPWATYHWRRTRISISCAAEYPREKLMKISAAPPPARWLMVHP